MMSLNDRTILNNSAHILFSYYCFAYIYTVLGGETKLRPKGTCQIINLELADFIFKQSKYPECMQVANK